MDGGEDNDAMGLEDLGAWSPHQTQPPRKDSQNMLFLAVEYVGEPNESFGSFAATGTSFSDDGQDTSLPCLSSLDSVYTVNKSVIVVNGGDSSSPDVGSSSCLSSSSSSVRPAPPSLLPPLSSVPAANPVIVSPSSMSPDHRSPSSLVSFEASLPSQNVVLDSTTASGSSSTINVHQPRRIIINNICGREGTPLQLDSFLSFESGLLPNQNAEILDSRYGTPSLDRVELVFGNTDENGVSYTLDPAMLSLRPLINSEACPVLGSKGASLVLEQGEDGEVRVRKSNLLSEDCFQDLVQTESRLLDTISHPVQLSTLMDDYSSKSDERAFHAVFAHDADHASYSPGIADEGAGSVLIADRSVPSALMQCEDITQKAHCPQELPQRHRPVLAEKTFTLENKINLISDDSNRSFLKKNLEMWSTGSNWAGDCIPCVSGDCEEHVVQSISDKPVPSRAWATLPANFLMVNKFSDPLTGQVVTGVFARKLIPKHTQFGPLEGLLVRKDIDKEKVVSSTLQFMIESEAGSMLTVDLSDENHSNWMRFVRSATCLAEQNVALSQHGESLYFRTIRDIQQRQELLVWYSHAYAVRRNLSLEPLHRTGLVSCPPWTCFKCNKAFTNSVDVQKHLNEHDNEPDENEDISLNIEKCNNAVRPQVPQKAKGTGQKGSEKMIHQCNTCKRVFLRNYSLKRHMLMHSREKKLSCPKCSLKFTDHVIKERHMRTVHRVEAVKKAGKPLQTALDFSMWNAWMCSKCSMVFNKPALLDLHFLKHKCSTDIHPEEREYRLEDGRYQCPECTLMFPGLKNLIDHASAHGRIRIKSKRKTDPSKPFRCLECYKGFANEERLQQHMLVHGSEDLKPKQCTVCSKRFLNNSALACHLKTHTNQSKIWDCPICKQTFEHVIALREHTNSHSHNGCFTCPFCKKLFTGYGPVRKHIRSFHNERTQKCMLCSRHFPTHDKLRMHMLRHSDHREFLCANCGKQFKRKDKLNEHMKRMHEREQFSKNRKASKVSLKQKKVPSKNRKIVDASANDYETCVFKCHPCLQGFKRRGMLVNHLAKRHPNIAPEQVPELNMPILKTTRDYFCQYCEKVYKSSSKRKAHILKYHPGSELPINSVYFTKQASSDQLMNPPFTQTAGTEAKEPQSCPWCYKQYATKAKLLQHQRSKHADKSCPEVRKPVKSKTSKPTAVEVGTQNEPSPTGESIILAECTMTLLERLEVYQAPEVQNECEPMKKSDSNIHQEPTDLLSQAMSELVQDSDYRAQYLRSSDDLHYHQLDTPHIIAPKTVYTPYPPR